ncbi:Fasciclin domain-containing protein [Rhizoctonia solani]|uniref:Fasciclin domain-containing protein n=1 Tax=Rhizoctonia solani TaxID=456999 RepID=A0A8H8P5I6_9AGAM|nr:Fasciclin domain-containing protein [Rhizoctonia solani]QRW25630.1 Fasciclin domain-containing protein [Rhizoctonia solani]
MKLLSQFVLTLLATLSVIQAASVAPRNNDYFLSEFLDALNKNNLTTLANSYEKIAQTDAGGEVIDALKNNGKVTLLAPENESFKSSTDELGANVLLYNTIWGSIYEHFKLPRIIPQRLHPRDIAQTAYPRPAGSRKRTYNLQDYQVQVIDQFSNNDSDSWKRWSNDPLILIDRAVGSAKVVGSFTFKNIIVLIIDSVLSLPGKVSDLLCKPLIKNAPEGFVKFGSALQKAGLLNSLDNRGARLTLFAPIDDEFATLTSSPKKAQIFPEESFFLWQGGVLALFPSVRKATAESGKQLEFLFENDINYVRCGNTKAAVLRSDVISENGVLHVIDRPLKCD